VKLEAVDLDVKLGGRRVLHGVRLAIEPGRIVGILGPNGAGKTTLLRTLAGLTPASAGTVKLDDRRLSAWSDHERSRRLGYVPQRSELRTGLSVRRVVQLARYGHRGPLSRWTREDVDAVQSGLQTMDAAIFEARPFTELSEGERRRVLIARALATGARCLLLDEPSAALDLAHGLALFASLRKLRDRGYAIGVVLHDINEAWDLVDEAIVLSEGRALAQGPRDHALSAEVVRAAFRVEVIPGGGFGYRPLEAP
jgi:iron complex transport system ATP-binding protein